MLPNWGLFGESCPFQEPVTCLEFHNNSSPNKKFHLSLKGPMKGVSPKQRLYGNKCQFPDPYLAYPSGSPVKEPSLQVPLLELPHLGCSVSRALYHSSFKVPVTLSPSSPVGPCDHLQNLPLHIFRVPSNGDVLQVPLTGLL